MRITEMPLLVFTPWFFPAFFRKGKKRSWSVMQSDDGFIQAFTVLRSNWNIDQNLECLLEEYVCSLYGEKKLSVNEVILHLSKKT